MRGEHVVVDRTQVRFLAEAAVVAAGHLLLGLLSRWIAPLPGAVSGVWLPAGLALAATLRLGRSGVAGVAAASLAHPLLLGVAPVPALGACAATLAGAWLGARGCGTEARHGFFDTPRHAARFLIRGAFAPQLVAAAIGVSMAATVGWFDPLPWTQAWLHWWAGASVGVVLTAPLLLAWPTRAEWGEHSVALLVATLASAASAYVVFFDPLGPLPIGWACFVVVALAGAFSGVFGAAVAAFVTGLLCVAGNAAGHGLFVAFGPHAITSLTAVFCSALSATGLVVASALAERSAAERRRSATEADLAFALEAAGLDSYEWDLDADRGILGALIAPAYGLPRARVELSRDRLLELVHPDDRARVAADMDAAQRAPLPARFESQHRTTPTAAPRWVSVRGRIDRDASGRRRARGVISDITEQRHIEAALRQSQRLESVGRLAGGVAHDFNNLLTVILGETELMVASDGADWRDGAERIQAAGERARALTRQLLAFARRQVMQPVVFRLDESLRQGIPLLRRLIDDHIELTVSLGSHPWTVRADPLQLEQVVLNLVVNARDAMPEGGKIAISTAQEWGRPPGVEVGVPGDWVVVTVVDSGAGIESDTLEHVFEPFFTTKSGGTGLGLATCFGLVRQMAGSITVESEPGQGARFSVWLPRAADLEPAAADPPAASADVPRAACILVVEDQDHVREVARRALEGAGHRVLVAANAAEALAVAASGEPIDLVLMDVLLPDLDGREAARRIVARRPALRVLYVSGYSNRLLERGDALDEGVALLEKPYTIRQLLDRVREQLEAS